MSKDDLRRQTLVALIVVAILFAIAMVGAWATKPVFDPESDLRQAELNWRESVSWIFYAAMLVVCVIVGVQARRIHRLAIGNSQAP